MHRKNMDVVEGGSESSDSSASSFSSGRIPRLGICEVCNSLEAKYTCPRCEVKTCCLGCLQIHKKELKCSGIRDRTKYIPVKQMTKMDFMSDYNFLEECTRFVEDRKCDKTKKFSQFNKMLPTNQFRLRNAAKERKIALRFLLQNFTRSKSNTTHYVHKSKLIFWRVEWIFPNAENLKFADDSLNETEVLGKLLDKYLNPDSREEYAGKSSLAYYQSRGANTIKVLLKAEGVKKSQTRYYELDIKDSLRNNLAGKTLVEFPIIYVIFNDIADNYDLIDSDDEVEKEAISYQQELTELQKKMKAEQNDLTERACEEVNENVNRLTIAKKQDERRKRRKDYENEMHNFLFTDETMWDMLSSSDEEGGNVTEEESEMASPPKKIKMEQ